jgi:hypothetical protein
LFEPETTIERVEQAHEQRAEEEPDDDGRTGLESQAALAQLEQVRQDAQTKADQFEEHEATLRERFAKAGE